MISHFHYLYLWLGHSLQVALSVLRKRYHLYKDGVDGREEFVCLLLYLCLLACLMYGLCCAGLGFCKASLFLCFVSFDCRLLFGRLSSIHFELLNRHFYLGAVLDLKDGCSFVEQIS